MRRLSIVLFFILIINPVVFSIDAAVQWDRDHSVFFKNDQYIRFDYQSLRAEQGYPKNINMANWPGIGFGSIDAAFNDEQGNAYIFSDDHYIMYDTKENKALQQTPVKIGQGVLKDFPFDRLDSACYYRTNEVLLFNNDEYARYDIDQFKLLPGYPQKISESPLADSGFMRFDSALRAANGIIYLFNGDEYTRFDIGSNRIADGYPKPITRWRNVVFDAQAIRDAADTDTEIAFYSGNFESLLEYASDVKKPVMVDVFASWCGPCKWLENNVFNDADVASYINSNFVSWRVDVEKGEGVSLSSDWGVHAYPTILFLTPDGSIFYRYEGAANPSSFTQKAAYALEHYSQGPVTQRDKAAESSGDAGLVIGIPDGSQQVLVMNKEMELKVLSLVNAERAKKGLQPLSYSETLSRAARYHAADMALSNYFDHKSYDRTDLGDLVYVCDTFDRVHRFEPRARGENIAAGNTTAEAVVRSWMNSPGHRANILKKDFTKLGIGYYSHENGAYKHYWVQNFQ